MNKPHNIYNYKAPKSGNEETHFFFTRGRITINAFMLRLILTICIYYAVDLIYKYYALEKYASKITTDLDGQQVIYDSRFLATFKTFETFHHLVLPIILGLFLVIQAIKRIHDTNQSGWFIFIPVYNIILLFTKGTQGNNDFGVDPRPQKVVQYFDELQ